MKLIFDFKMNNLPTELMNLFKFNHNVSNYTTRNASKKGIFILCIITESFGAKSLKYSAALLWNI